MKWTKTKKLFACVLAGCILLSCVRIDVNSLGIDALDTAYISNVTDADLLLEPTTTNKYYVYQSTPVTYSSVPADVHETIESAATNLRNGMKARQSEIVINLLNNADYDISSCSRICQEIHDAALIHTGTPNEGDYLRWQCGGYRSVFRTSEEVVKFTYRHTYYTTSSQETELDTAVDALLDELNLWYATDYDKISVVYEWICQNVAYDYDNLENEDYVLKYTAYAALVDRTAVCQGYSNLLYRLLLELGIDNRIITGTGNGGAHAWNIVQLDGLYYNVDVTWDASRHQAGMEYGFFLLPDATFENHIRDEEYATDSFYQEYPMQESDYNPVCTEHQYVAVVTEPTCTEMGFTTHTCIHCGSAYLDSWVAAGHSFHDNVCQKCDLRLVAVGACGDDLTWNLSEDDNLTISGSGDMWGFHDDSSGTFVNRPWEEFANEIISVTIGDDVNSIGEGAFRDCEKLTSVFFGEGLTFIKSWAFYRCSSLTAFELPESLTSIGQQAFDSCKKLQTIVIPSCVSYLGGSKEPLNK